MDADELYRLAPEDFTAARDSAARARRTAGDRDGAAALRALRRPSVAAWLVNRLAQQDGELLGSLLDLGPELARAQSGGDAAALRALGASRRELVDAVTARAVEHGGRPVTAAVRAEVQATLEAALADPASASAVRSGRLVRALSYAGLGEVDLAGAVAPSSVAPASAGRVAGPTDDPAPSRRRQRAAAAEAAAELVAQQVAAAEAAAQQAAGGLDDAVRACEAAERTRAATAAAADEAAAEVARRAEQLAAAERAEADAAERARAAEAAAGRALAEVERAQAAAERARQELDRLRRGVSGR